MVEQHAWNIIRSGRRRRLVQGLVLAIASLSATVLLMRNEAMAAWYGIVFILVLVASLMLLQARDRTCVLLAARGARERAGGGVEAIDDPEMVRQLKRQATHVFLEAVAIAVVAIAVVMLARGLLAAHLPPTFYSPE
jgi:hypothetical protein